MNKIGKLGVIALVLVLFIGLSCPIYAASDSGGDTLIPITEAAEISAASYNNANVPVTAEPVTSVTTSREPAIIEPPVTNRTPGQEDDDDGGWFSWLLDGIKKFFKGLLEDIKGIGKSITSIPDNIVKGFTNLLKDWINMGSGELGLINLLQDGGARYVSDRLNDLINGIYNVFYVPGIVIMMICFCYGIFKGCYSLEFADKNSIVKPVIGMIIALFAFTVAKEVMTALFTLSLNLTDKIVIAARRAGVSATVEAIMSSSMATIGYMIVTGIMELILMLNIAKIALMQCTAPLYIGFSAAENSRRIMINFVKEYAKCCLVPPITAAYSFMTFCICDSTWKVFGSIVMGISIWSIATKHLDKILN